MVNLKETKKQRLSAVLFVIAILIGLTGIILVFRGSITYLKNKGTANLNQINLLKLNSPVNLKTFEITNSVVSINESFKDLENPFVISEQERVWLLLKNKDYQSIAYLDESHNVSEIYKLDLEASIIKIYENLSISFVLNSTQQMNANLVIGNLDGEVNKIVELKEYENFTSTFFEKEEDLFYYSYIDQNNITHIEAVTLDGKIFKIYKSSGFSNLQIINVDNSTLTIFFQDNACYKLGILDKSIKKVECLNIKFNKENIIIGLRKNSMEISKEVGITALSLDENLVTSSYYYKDNAVYLLGNQNKINKISINNFSTKELAEWSLDGKVEEIFTLGSQVFLIVKNKYEELIYKLSDQSKPLSYSETYGWEEVKLSDEVFTNISVINPQYFVY